MTILIEKENRITIISMNRPEVRNAVNPEMATALTQAFLDFDQDAASDVAVLCAMGGNFCAGADLKAVANQEFQLEQLAPDVLQGPLGPTRLLLSKPVIAAVSGYAVAGGLELALWCDLRIVEENAVFGVFCRRFGVPLIDGGTIRLPRLIGLSRALDMILTGRSVDAIEALQFGLANRVVAVGSAKEEAINLAKQLTQFPQHCLRNDRQSAYEQVHLPLKLALENEFTLGQKTLQSQETVSGAQQFVKGHGRHGQF